MKYIFGKKIKELRKKRGLNQTEMAELLGVHLQTVSRYERGELTPSPEILSVLAEKFKVDINWLFADENEINSATAYSTEPVPATSIADKRDDYYGCDPVIDKINILLAMMDSGQRQDVLRYVEERKLLAGLKVEKQRKAR